MKRRAPAIAMLLIITTLMIYLYGAMSCLRLLDIRLIKMVNSIIIVSTVFLILFEIMRCKITYKYFIIANKLIINKLFLEKEKTVESINISDIVYIGEKSDIPKEYNTKFTGSHLFKLISGKAYCCIYKTNSRYYKFNFAPSDELLRRLHTKIKWLLKNN